MSKSKPPHPGGRPSHVPTEVTRALVRTLAGFGIEQEHIAAKIGISSPTLRKHYKPEIELAKSEVMAAVVGSLFKKAIDPKGGMPSVTAGIWITKNLGGWRDSTSVAHTDAEGGKLPPAQPVRIYLPANTRFDALPPPTIEGSRVPD